jgi:ribose transport system permease protein
VTVGALGKDVRKFGENTLLQLRQNQSLVVWLTLLALAIVATATSPVFLTQRNFLNIFRQASVLGIIAVGQTVVLLSSGADLSQSTMMTLSAVVAFQVLSGKDEMILPVILISVVMGAIVGLFNGIMVSKVKVPPFLMTLGTREIIYGLGLVFTHGAPQGFITPLFRKVLGRIDVFGVPGQVFIWLAMVAIGWFLLSKTTFGRRLYATGGNRRAAEQSGIKTDRVVITAYIISGILAAFAGLVLGARSGNADNSMGTGYELNAVAASVIGGTSFTGGRGGLIGTVGGVLLMTMIQNVLNIHGVNPDIYLIVMGLVIVAAVVIIKGE